MKATYQQPTMLNFGVARPTPTSSGLQRATLHLKRHRLAGLVIKDAAGRGEGGDMELPTQELLTQLFEKGSMFTVGLPSVQATQTAFDAFHTAPRWA